MATLYSLETAAAVKRYVSETGRAIQAGLLAPGSTISLRDAADELGVRRSSLHSQLEQLERDGLLAVDRSGTATVAPLDPAEVGAICRLLLAIVPTLNAAASARISPLAARRIHRDAALINDLPIENRYDAMTELFVNLMRPAATEVELNQLRFLHTGLQRYHHIGITDMIRNQDDEFLRYREIREELNGTFNIGDADGAYRISQLLIAAYERFGTHSLTVAASDGASSRAFAGKAPILRLV